MEYALIEHGSDAYKQSLSLRHEILRVPLGMDLYDGSYDDLSQEHRFYHFGAFDDHDLVASVMGIPTSPTEVRIKQMVVAERLQSKGFGKRLFMAFEAFLLNLGVESFVLHARQAAHGFYLNMGYVIVGEQFDEVGIPHFKMRKTFVPRPD
jgi:predicted GNAT family N-acyltransferase